MEVGILSQKAEDYHASAGVSKSMLDALADPFSPLHFHARYIAKTLPAKSTKALFKGSLVHRLILEPDTMTGAFYVEPAELTIAATRLPKLKSAKLLREEGESAVIEWNPALVEADEWRKAHADRPIVTVTEAECVKGMRDAVWRHPIAKKLLAKAQTEKSVFAVEDGVLRRSRVDALPASASLIVDVKSIRSADDRTMRAAIAERRYHVQAAYYLDNLALAGDRRQAFAFIFVENAAPYDVVVRELEEGDEMAGRNTYRANLLTYRRCMESNNWPGRDDTYGSISRPEWAQRQDGIQEI